METLDQREPIGSRHPDIEEDEVGSLRADQLFRLLYVVGFAGDGDVGVILQHLPEPLPGERLVVHQQDAQGAHSVAPGSTPFT
jgi:hypothetical protein